MVRLKINGIPVEMPYEPYPPQLVTISKLLSCFQNGTSALVESPTGTGKSLSILCSALAYNRFVQRDIQRKDEDRKPYKIIICSRTHKQLEQLVEQLKKTSYSPRIAILGSRAQYCVNPLLRETEDKNTACSELVKMGKCIYFNKKDKFAMKVADMILNIEELKAEGTSCHGCPYFASRMLAKDAEVIFAPYNYLVNSNIRHIIDIPLSRAIIVVDEAHNIEDVCRTEGSLELTSQNMEILSNDLFGAVKHAAFLGEIKSDFMNLLDLFKRLREYAEKQERGPLAPASKLPAQQSTLKFADGRGQNTKDFAKSMSSSGGSQQADSFFNTTNFESKMRICKEKDIIKELESMGITEPFLNLVRKSLENISADEEGKELLTQNTNEAIDSVLGVLKLVFSDCKVYAFCFQRFNSGNRYTFNFWLLDPSTTFHRVACDAWSVSLLSGTLTPFSSFASELNYKFTHQVVAPHILRPKQVFIAAINKGHTGQPLYGTYSTTETFTYLDQIATIAVDVAKRVREFGGTLVFVPNYAFLSRLAARIPDSLSEPRSGGLSEFEKVLKTYRMRINNRRTAILICVFRGKAAEGTDFRDEYARAVITVGIPYPSIKDPQIGLKKEYNDKKGGGFNGRMWYEAQAYRAINQALGRIIRHTADWGVLYLLDSRFFEKRCQAQLPQWVTQNIRFFQTHDDSVPHLNAFVNSYRKNEV